MVFEQLRTELMLEALKQVDGFEPWMLNWVFITEKRESANIVRDLYNCYHPDNECFLVTSDPEEVVKGFSKFPYEG
jgi:hypothetical protein